MTPLHEGSSKPVRGAGGEGKTDKKVVVNTLNSDCGRGQTSQSFSDGSRPLKTKKRARRRQKSRSAGFNNHHGNGDDGVKANSPLVQNGSHAHVPPQARDGQTQDMKSQGVKSQGVKIHGAKTHDGKPIGANGKKRRRKRSTFARANQTLQPAIMGGANKHPQSLQFENHHSDGVADNDDLCVVAPKDKKPLKNTIDRKPTEKAFAPNHDVDGGDTAPLDFAHVNNGHDNRLASDERDEKPSSHHDRRYRKFHLKRHAVKQERGKHVGGRNANGKQISRNHSFEKQVGLLGGDERLNCDVKAPFNAFNDFAKTTHQNGLYAALDLGTNNCRLLIASPTRPGYFRVIDAFSRIVRLGEGLSRNNRLSEAAMARAIEALKICAAKLSQFKISHQRLIATEACRSAENGGAFIARVKVETGLDLEIVNRETEARLAVSGCGTLVEPDTEAIVLFDIGGGSSEIALIDVSHRRSPRLADHIIAWTSLPVGVVSLAERFGGISVSSDDFLAMKNYVSDLLKNFHDRKKLGSLVDSQGFHLLGTSGTVTTLAGIHLKLERYDRRRIDGMWMQSAEVDKMTAKLLSWSMSERVANPCIGADRADLVLAGCAILEAIRDLWPSGRLRVADRGLREGILTELMSHSGAWRKNRFARRQNHYDKVHNK